MIKLNSRLLSKVIKGAKKQGRDTSKLDRAQIDMTIRGNEFWTSRKCNSFSDIERVFDDAKRTRPWRG